ncbi:hypothetical protein RHMOL_Rhmol05G0151500 [Rhododendron molle]|uniref:Uncharacterized protein n=1 Tax=Rhododendron molle TaxID=49168 RepID=A0ACC0NRM4_RHOML|nr:hypothetical protein RHMOL_Rhmol05G0151500 [Rhododendron molle]
MEIDTGDQCLAEAVGAEGAVVARHDGGDDGREKEVGGRDEHRATETDPPVTEEARAVELVVQPLDPGMEVAGSVVAGRSSEHGGHGSDGRAPEAEPRATVVSGVVGPNVEPMGSGTMGEGLPIIGGGSGDAGGSGEVVMLSQSATTAASSSSHRPITKYYVAEHLPDEALVKLLEDNPMIGEIVLKAKEDRARAIAAMEAAARAEREQKEREELLRDAEAKERAEAEVQWPRVTAVTEAGVVPRPDFSAEAYVPPTPHPFMPSGFAVYVPKWTEYDDELVLRDPEVHIANT